MNTEIKAPKEQPAQVPPGEVDAFLESFLDDLHFRTQGRVRTNTDKLEAQLLQLHLSLQEAMVMAMAPSPLPSDLINQITVLVKSVETNLRMLANEPVIVKKEQP